MAFPQGINFRQTSGYVADSAGETYENLDATTYNYPRTTPQGNTVGWVAGTGSDFNQIRARNRNSGNDRRLAGVGVTTGVVNYYRIDLPSAGTYNIRVAAGDASYASSVVIDVYDNTTLLANLTTGSTSAAQRFKDATNVERTNATWAGSNVLRALTFTSTVCILKLASNAVIAHFYIESASVTAVSSLAIAIASTTAMQALVQGSSTKSVAGSATSALQVLVQAVSSCTIPLASATTFGVALVGVSSAPVAIAGVTTFGVGVQAASTLLVALQATTAMQAIVAASSTKAIAVGASTTLTATVALNSARVVGISGTAALTNLAQAISAQPIVIGGATSFAVEIAVSSLKLIAIGGGITLLVVAFDILRMKRVRDVTPAMRVRDATHSMIVRNITD